MGWGQLGLRCEGIGVEGLGFVFRVWIFFG